MDNCSFHQGDFVENQLCSMLRNHGVELIFKPPYSGFKTSRRLPEFRRLLDCMSPATLVITVYSWQTISALLLIRKSLRQHSNFTLNFAAIIHTQKDVSVVQKKLKSSAISCAVRICVLSLSGRANLVWACDDVGRLFFFFWSLQADSMAEKRKHQTVNTLFLIWVQKVTILR